MNKPDYIEIDFRVRCDGWWRKTLIGVVLFIISVGGLTNLVRSSNHSSENE